MLHGAKGPLRGSCILNLGWEVPGVTIVSTLLIWIHPPCSMVTAGHHNAKDSRLAMFLAPLLWHQQGFKVPRVPGLRTQGTMCLHTQPLCHGVNTCGGCRAPLSLPSPTCCCDLSQLHPDAQWCRDRVSFRGGITVPIWVTC